MPLPKPNRGEQHDRWISRCMANPVMQREYSNRNQRLAVCENLWGRRGIATGDGIMSKKLRVGNKRTKTIEKTASKVDARVGKPVFFMVDDSRVAGVFVKSVGGESVVELALPDADGILHRVGTRITMPEDALRTAEDLVLADSPLRVKAWDASLELSSKEPTPVWEGEEDKSRIIDYQDVVIEGYLSTFVSTTPADRDGDYVEPDAFKETLAQFKENPVMLVDHDRRTHALAGSFTNISVNDAGLAVRGKLSNAPGLVDVRFKVVEGHLKALSMGGLFYYKDDGRGIFKVDLWEGSLVPVPANQDALFQVRSLTAVDVAKVFKRFTKSHKLMMA